MQYYRELTYFCKHSEALLHGQAGIILLFDSFYKYIILLMYICSWSKKVLALVSLLLEAPESRDSSILMSVQFDENCMLTIMYMNDYSAH